MAKYKPISKAKVARIAKSLSATHTPWMWSSDLPKNYGNTQCIPGEAGYIGPLPLILRGSREMMYRTSERRCNFSLKFVRRSARLYRLCLTGKRMDWSKTDQDIVYKILRAAGERWPNARSYGTFFYPSHGMVMRDGLWVMDEIAEQAAEILETNNLWEAREKELLLASIERSLRYIASTEKELQT